MRELYKEFFYVPKHGKVREKVMLARTAMTVVIMVICLAAMSITAYAYFSYNVTSVSNIIKAANFEAEVSIKITDPENGTDVPITPAENLTQTAKLEAGKTYSITLTPGDSTAKTGFCVIKAVGCSDTYHTQQFGKDQTIEANAESVTFTLTVTQDTVVSFMSHWGTSSHYPDYQNANEGDEPDKLYITNTENNIVNMVINGVVNSISDTGEGDGTTPSETTPTETTPTEVTYTVQSGDTLESIAKEYNTTAEKIAAYNNLADKNTIVVGQQLKIPPADYEIPAGSTETTETTTPTSDTTTPSATTTPSETTEPAETTTTTEPSETTVPTETTTETTGETTSTTEPTTTTTETQPAATSTEPDGTETTGATTTEASE